MIQLIKLIWQLVIASFQPSRKIQMQAGFAGSCLVLSGAFAGLTAWLSYPAYFAMAPEPDPRAIWFIAGFVALMMFYATSTIGRFIAEISKKVEPLISLRELAFVVLIAVAVGGFDAYKGFETGADERARQRHEVLSYEEVTAGNLKPYQTEIDQLTEEIGRLLGDEQKVMWRGRLTTPYKNVQIAEKLSLKRDAYQAQQLTAIAEAKTLHEERTQHTRSNQTSAKKTLQGLSIFIYLIQILLAIPLGLFSVDWDLMDGVRDGQNQLVSNKSSSQDALHKIETYSPKEESAQSDDQIPREGGLPSGAGSPEEYARQEERKSLYRDTKIGFHHTLTSGENVGKNPPAIPRSKNTQSPSLKVVERVITGGHMDNVHPQFSRIVQPDKYRGLDQRKYRKAVREAKVVLADLGKYNKTEIARRVGLDRKTITKYLRVGIENGDLPDS